METKPLKYYDLNDSALDWAVARGLDMPMDEPKYARNEDVEHLQIPFVLWETTSVYVDGSDEPIRVEVTPITVTRYGINHAVGATAPSITFVDDCGQTALGSVRNYHLTKEDAEYAARCEMSGIFSEEFNPSKNLDQAGIIILREKIEIMRVNDVHFPKGNENVDSSETLWIARIQVNGMHSPWVHGRTNLEAAMRSFVKHKLGDTVDVPAEILSEQTKSQAERYTAPRG